MIVKQQLSTRLLYLTLLWCVFSFKVVLFGVNEAGLRVDDILMALAFFVLLFRGDLLRVPRSPALRTYLLFISVSIFSAVWNGIAGRVHILYSLLFVTRLVQYLVFYYLGYVLAESGIDIWKALRIYFYILCVVVPLQMFHLLPTASAFDVSRASGNTNGPYELAVVAAFFLCYFSYVKRKRVAAIASFGLLLLSASRITLAGSVIIFCWRFLQSRKSKLLSAAVVCLIVCSLWIGGKVISTHYASQSDSNSIGSRLNSSSSLLSVDFFSIYNSVPVYSNSDDYFAGTFIDALSLATGVDADRSGALRVIRWATLIKSTLAHVDSIMIGLGPSFGSAAVDGYYVRVFTETGVVGIIAILLFYRALLRAKFPQAAGFHEFVIILIITGFFIDIFTSYKTMMFLWLWSGMNELESKQNLRPVAAIDS